MPPPELSTSNSGSVASYRPPRTTYTPAPTPPARSSSDDPLFPGPTAITRSSSLRPGSSSSIPPPEPPVVLPSAPDALDLLPRATASGVRNSTASYEPFLSHAPAPVDSWIEVETTAAEYRLIVRLPGFKRDGITLATKKRRILHVVADSWDAGGGHFERRISFGYDADLAQVRAEFDGELLRVIIPRRMPPGAVGR
ncbi:hypothetical protein C8J57DRAFT_1055844 [Mycena rebaudengoi]|nr:hypothetical protein C8J57DRAFT_1055844 [Mycena rebaudengoi]